MGKFSVGIALGGGGARGIAHIGLLQVMAEHGMTADRVSGTSAGALIGAMYASRPDPFWIEERFREFLTSRAFKNLGTDRLAKRHEGAETVSAFGKRLQDHFVVNLSLMRQYVIPREVLNAAVEFLVPARRFQDLELPMVVCAADLQSGLPIHYESGDLVMALANSSSIPGVLEPDLSGQSIVVDGGVLTPVPVSALRDQVHFVIASEISRRGLPPLDDVNIYALMMRSEQLTQRELARHQASLADFVFCPDVMSLHWSQFAEFDQLLQNGREEALKRMPELKRKLRLARSPWGALRRGLARFSKR
jgi:NTE family protein